MNTVEKDADEPAAVAGMVAEDQEVLAARSTARWGDMMDALEKPVEEVDQRAMS